MRDRRLGSLDVTARRARAVAHQLARGWHMEPGITERVPVRRVEGRATLPMTSVVRRGGVQMAGLCGRGGPRSTHDGTNAVSAFVPSKEARLAPPRRSLRDTRSFSARVTPQDAMSGRGPRRIPVTALSLSERGGYKL